MKWILWDGGGLPLTELHHCIATIGVFDGVHVGHRAVLDQTTAWAQTEGRPAVAITFGVHPDQIVHGRAPRSLMSLEHRRRELARCGLDATLVLPFDQRIRSMEAETFVQSLLVDALCARGVILGYDTAVGKDRRGDAELLTALGREHGFEVRVAGRIEVDGGEVSSTRIRAACRAGDLEQVGRLLGRPYSIIGQVVHGEGIGRTLGFPTANLACEAEFLPGEGVYAVLALFQGTRRRGLCNIGRRPTVHADAPPTVEVHLLDFEGTLYGEEMDVLFLARLRAEQRFPDVDHLCRQIERDRDHAEEVFRKLRGHLGDA